MSDVWLKFQALSLVVRVLLSLLIMANLVLDAWALIDLYKRPLVLWGNKWLWVPIILFVSTFGALFYLALGRRVHAEINEPQRTPGEAGERARRAVDSLYGPKS